MIRKFKKKKKCREVFCHHPDRPDQSVSRGNTRSKVRSHCSAEAPESGGERGTLWGRRGHNSVSVPLAQQGAAYSKQIESKREGNGSGKGVLPMCLKNVPGVKLFVKTGKGRVLRTAYSTEGNPPQEESNALVEKPAMTKCPHPTL